MNSIVLASNNPGKLAEFSQAFEPLKINVKCMADFDLESPEETGLSFIENAILKARYVSEKTGLPALADDSGVSVTALNGAPGIYSARYAGDNAKDSDNIDHLLAEMSDLTGDQRAAQVHCVLAFVRHATDPVPLIAQGLVNAEILTERQGDGGFGYDPVLFIPEADKTFAQMTKGEKRSCSHRGRAVADFLQNMR